jgi:hypothetical protein
MGGFPSENGWRCTKTLLGLPGAIINSVIAKVSFVSFVSFVYFDCFDCPPFVPSFTRTAHRGSMARDLMSMVRYAVRLRGATAVERFCLFGPPKRVCEGPVYLPRP